jgi:hypothetical protein
MITLTKAISLLGKRVWTVWVANPQYGVVRQGLLLHVILHAEKAKRGEWHAYVVTNSGGGDYAGCDMFLKKTDAEDEKNRQLKDGDER